MCEAHEHFVDNSGYMLQKNGILRDPEGKIICRTSDLPSMKPARPRDGDFAKLLRLKSGKQVVVQRLSDNDEGEHVTFSYMITNPADTRQEISVDVCQSAGDDIELANALFAKAEEYVEKMVNNSTNELKELLI